jgi:hypothetical protein
MKTLNWKIPVSILIISFAYLWNIGTPVMWGDEAGTAIFARNIIKTGVPVGFDGRNLAVFGNCASVSTSLLSKKIPWAQFYIGSLSIMFFGETTVGARLLFVLIGMCAFFPLYSVLKKQSPHAALITTLVLISPQIVLFQRNVRYYPMLIFLFCFLLWTYSYDFRSQKLRFAFVCICSLLLFHTHQLAAFCTMISFLIFCLLRDRKCIKIYLPAFLLGLASWLIFYISLKSVPGSNYEMVRLLFEHTSGWAAVFFNGIKASVLDLDFVNALPLMVWAIIFILALSKRNRGNIFSVLGTPISLLILINLGVQIIVTSALIGFETRNQYSVLRFMPHLITTAIIPLLLVIETLLSKALGNRTAKIWLIPAGFILITISNVFSFSYWFPPLPGRNYRVSWWTPVYSEIIKREPDSIKMVIDTISQENISNDSTIVVWPPYLNEVFSFYVGHRNLIRPSVLRNSECEKCVIRKIGVTAYNRFYKNPKWYIIFQDSPGKTPPGYELIKIPFYRHSPDATRPELTRHGFIANSNRQIRYINIYRKL